MIDFNTIFRAVKEAYDLSEKLLQEFADALIPDTDGNVPLCKEKIFAQEVMRFRSLVESLSSNIDKYGLQQDSVEELRICVETFCVWVKNNFKNHQTISEWIFETINFAFDQRGVS